MIRRIGRFPSMIWHSRRLAVFSCAMLLAVSEGTLGSAAGQVRGATTVRVHVDHSAVSRTRCARRAKTTGAARFAGPLTSTDSLNPYQGSAIPGLIDSYFASGSKLNLSPEMAISVPTLKNGEIRDGGRTIIIHLKQGLRWSNGAEITSQDAKFGWMIDKNKATGPYCVGACAEITRVDTPDRYTIVFHLKHVTPDFLLAGLPFIWPVKWPGAWNGNPRTAAIKLGQDPTFTFEGPAFPTDGPYQVAQVVKDKQIVLKPMKYYGTMSCGGFIHTIVIPVVGSDASMISAAADGGVDIWEASVGAVDLLPEIRRHAGYSVHVDPAFGLEHLEFNTDTTYNGAPNPLHNASVRLALALALDKLHLVRTVLPVDAKQARGILAWTPWIDTPGLVQQFADTTIRGQWDPIAGRYLSDTGHGQALADARALLGRTQWKHGFAIDFQTTDSAHRRTAVSVLTAAWARLGVKVRATFLASRSDGGNKLFDSWNDGGILAHGLFQATLFTGIGGNPDSLLFDLTKAYIDRRRTDHSGPNDNFSGIDNQVIESAFHRTSRTVSSSVRASSFAAIQQEVNRQAYWIPLYFPPYVWTSNGRVRNVSFSPGYFGVGWNIWAWRVRGR